MITYQLVLLWMEPFVQETVYFGFLNRGPNRTQDVAGAEQLQKDQNSRSRASRSWKPTGTSGACSRAG